MLRRIFRDVCLVPGGRLIVAGAIGVLVGLEHLLGTRSRKGGQRTSRGAEAQSKATALQPAVRRSPHRLFAIRRTKSDLGYTYWVLQGFDSCKCFHLFDTWQEAMDEATFRLRVNQSSGSSSLLLASGKTC